MARFTSTADVDEFAGELWSKALQAQLELLVQGAARAFYLAVTSRIPVRTGFLRGSFGTLAEAVRPVTAFPIVPTVTKREYYTHVRASGKRVLKTPTSGQRFATQSEGVFSRAKSNAIGRTSNNIAKDSIRSTGLITFDFANTIKYLDFNDQRLNWNSWNAGVQAFDDYIKANFERAVPDLLKYTNRTRIILNGTTIRTQRSVTPNG